MNEAGHGSGSASSAINLAAYNSIADQWDAARSTLWGREPFYLDVFLAGMPKGAQILDAGCGSGRPMAENLLARGYAVLGIDRSAAMLAKARERFPQGQWLEAQLEQYPFADPCCGVLCWDALFHLERCFHQPILARIANCLPPGGRLMLTVGGSAHPPFTDSMFHREFFYDSHPPQQVMAMLTALGFTLRLGEFMNPPTTGRDKGRYAIVAEKSMGRHDTIFP